MASQVELAREGKASGFFDLEDSEARAWQNT